MDSSAETKPLVTVFRSRLREEASQDYEVVARRMDALARAMPGFVDFKTFRADDGERVSIVVFDSLETHAAWRDHPEHRRAQARGRADFYAEYHILVCEQLHDRRFSRPGD